MIDADDFWRLLRVATEEIVEINRVGKVFDLTDCIESASCLGTAVNLIADAIQLVLVGLEKEAGEYFLSIKALALEAYSRGESYIYKDPDGNRSFAKYKAMCTAALCEWMLGGGERWAYFDAMLAHFREAVEAESQEFPLLEAEPDVVGTWSLHLAQAGRWDQVMNVVGKQSNSLAAGKWKEIIATNAALAMFMSEHGSSGKLYSNAKFDRWFRSHTVDRRYSNPLNFPYDPRFDAGEIVAIAEVRAHWLYGEEDPWVTVKSLRWPGLSPKGDPPALPRLCPRR